MANLHVIKRSHVNDVSLEVLYNEQLSWGVSQKSMPILAEIEDRKSQVHVFVESDPDMAPAKLAAQFKGYTSRVLRQEFRHLRSQLPSLWSRSYSIGSNSRS